MALELRINGRRSDYTLEGSLGDWPTFYRALCDDLLENGWLPKEVRLNGRAMRESQAAPEDWPGGTNRVEVDAIPAPESLERTRRELLAGLRDLAGQAAELGRSFGRGEWRAGLARTGDFLVEMRDLLSGLHAAAALGGESVEKEFAQIPLLLVELNEYLERQSWVELSDLLLHELAPLLERLAR